MNTEKKVPLECFAPPAQSRILINSYLDYRATENDLFKKIPSYSTVLAYRSDLYRFADWMDEKGLLLHEATAENVKDYLSSIRVRDRAPKPTFIARQHSSLNCFFEYLVSEEIVQSNPVEDVEKPKIVRSIPRCLARREVDRLLDVLDIDSPHEHRNRTMLEVLYRCGLNPSELVNLKLSQVKFGEKTLEIPGEKGRRRTIPMGHELYDWLIDFIQYFRGDILKGRKSDYVFPTRRGDRMTRQALWHITKNLAERAGIAEDRVSPMMFRHAYAAREREGGTSLSSLQTTLGHSEESTTKKAYGQIEKRPETRAQPILSGDATRGLV